MTSEAGNLRIDTALLAQRSVRGDELPFFRAELAAEFSSTEWNIRILRQLPDAAEVKDVRVEEDICGSVTDKWGHSCRGCCGARQVRNIFC